MSRGLSVVALIVMLLAGLTALPPVHAAGTVGDGTAASCTEAALDAALAGGGLVTFNCGGGPVTIELTNTKMISANTIIDGGGLVTLDGNGSLLRLGGGGGARRLFFVQTAVQLELLNVQLTGGFYETGAAVYVDRGTLIADHATFIGNRAFTGENDLDKANGGAIYNNAGRVTLVDSIFVGNMATSLGDPGRGGAIFNTGGLVEATRTRFALNAASFYGGGAIANEDGGTLTLRDSVFGFNLAGRGAGVFSLDSTTVINGGLFGVNIALTGSGGGVLEAQGTLDMINGVQFVTNLTPTYGGGLSISHSTVRVFEAHFRFNVAGRGAATGFGGGIYNNRGDMELAGITLVANRADRGGGLFNDNGSVQLIESIVRNNVAERGGGIYTRGHPEDFTTPEGVTFSRYTGVLDLQTSRILANRAFIHGGGMMTVGGDVDVKQSLFYRNGAGEQGGGLYGSVGGGLLTISNSTFGENSAPYGAAAANAGSYSYVTFNENHANEGAAIGGTYIRVEYSIIANTTGGNNCSAPLPGGTLTRNLEHPGGSCDTGHSEDPQLAPLAFYGGPTPTYALPITSPAVDFAPSLRAPACQGPDQRGILRAFDGDGDGDPRCDAGAYEMQDGEFDPELGFSTEPLVQPTNPPLPPPPPPPPVEPSCGNFGATSPRDGMPNGVTTFYWYGTPDATAYRVLVYNDRSETVAAADVPAPGTSVALDVGEGAIGPGFSFTWEVQALVNGDVFCSEGVQLLREATPVDPGPVCNNNQICEAGENANNCPNDCP